MSSVKEIAHVFGEGRARFGGQARRGKEKSQNEDESRRGGTVEPRRDARSGFDFARAVAELGVDRGIDAFARYGFIERNGLAYLATPLGRFEVPSDKEANTYAALIAEIDGWLDKLRRATRSTDKTPQRFISARLGIEDAIFALCASKDEGQRKEHLRAVLLALGAAETELARSPKFRDEHGIPPLASLTTAWADECDDDSPEYRIACALASIVDRDGLAPVRVHLEPVEYLSDKKRFDWSPNDVRVVWGAGRLVDNLALVLRRRWIDSRRDDLWRKVESETKVSVSNENAAQTMRAQRAMRARRFVQLDDVAEFIGEGVDESKIEKFLRALMLVNWRGEKRGKLLETSDDSQASRSDMRRALARLYSGYALLKLLFLSDEVFKRESDKEPPTDDQKPISDASKSPRDYFKPYSSTFNGVIRHEPNIVPLLLTNHQRQIDNAFKRAAQRLKISGFTPISDDFYLDERQGARLAAALLIPLGLIETGALCQAVLRPTEKDSTTKDNGEEQR